MFNTEERRGAARQSWFGAFLLLAAAMTAFRSFLLPVDVPATVIGIWIVSIMGVVIGFLQGFRDVRRLGLEWDGVREASAPDLIGRISALSAKLQSSLAVKRAKRIEYLTHVGGSVAQGAHARLRSEAFARTAGIGAASKFMSSMLLLLAVVGTFAGMKAAIPELANGIAGALSSGDHVGVPATSSAEPIVTALRAVAGAFGVNFIALLGAFALAIISFGAGTERKQLLIALERVSEEHLYPLLPSSTDATAIERIVLELRSSLGEIAAVATHISALRTSIGSFELSFESAVESLHASLSGQFQRDLLQSQKDMGARTDSIVRDVGSIANSLALTATAYEGVVQAIRERDLGLKEVSAEIGAQARAMSASVSDLADKAADTVLANRQAGEVLGTAAKGIAEQLGRSITIQSKSHQDNAKVTEEVLTNLALFAATANAVRDDIRSLVDQTTGAIRTSGETLQGYGDQVRASTEEVVALSRRSVVDTATEMETLRLAVAGAAEDVQNLIGNLTSSGEAMSASGDALIQLAGTVNADSGSNASAIRAFQTDLVALLNSQHSLLSDLKGAASELEKNASPLTHELVGLRSRVESATGVGADILVALTKLRDRTTGKPAGDNHEIADLIHEHRKTAEEFKSLLQEILRSLGAREPTNDEIAKRRTPQAWMRGVFRG